mmetsp:Transcript_11839/g.36055  ORF Transcript_11839/g.36055 Transcript_11839/m.36055 type:complete len:533 (+) Transcript_11839:273-1871(+)
MSVQFEDTPSKEKNATGNAVRFGGVTSSNASNPPSGDTKPRSSSSSSTTSNSSAPERSSKDKEKGQDAGAKEKSKTSEKSKSSDRTPSSRTSAKRKNLKKSPSVNSVFLRSVTPRDSSSSPRGSAHLSSTPRDMSVSSAVASAGGVSFSAAPDTSSTEDDDDADTLSSASPSKRNVKGSAIAGRSSAVSRDSGSQSSTQVPRRGSLQRVNTASNLRSVVKTVTPSTPTKKAKQRLGGTRLDFSNKKLATFLISPENKAMRKLTWLLLHNNRLRSIPGSNFYLLRGLRVLTLYNNKLSSLPPEISMLHKLRVLAAQNNKLTTLPSELGELPELEWIFVQNNCITTVPVELGKLQRIKQLNLTDNPLDGDDGYLTALVKQSKGPEKILQYCRCKRLEEEAARRLQIEEALASFASPSTGQLPTGTTSSGGGAPALHAGSPLSSPSSSSISAASPSSSTLFSSPSSGGIASFSAVSSASSLSSASSASTSSSKKHGKGHSKTVREKSSSSKWSRKSRSLKKDAFRSIEKPSSTPP